jgi:gluconolactonase
MSDATYAAGWRPATHYPDPAIHALDPRFEKYWLKLSAVERLPPACAGRRSGVVRRRALSVVQRHPNQRIIKWERRPARSALPQASNFANGNTRDRQGRLVTCEHGGRRVRRTEYDGSITVLMDSFNGKR